MGTTDPNCPPAMVIKFTTDIHGTFGSTLEDFNKVAPGYMSSGLVDLNFAGFGADPKTLVGGGVTCYEFNVAFVTSGLVVSNSYITFSACICGNEVLSTVSSDVIEFHYN